MKSLLLTTLFILLPCMAAADACTPDGSLCVDTLDGRHISEPPLSIGIYDVIKKEVIEWQTVSKTISIHKWDREHSGLNITPAVNYFDICNDIGTKYELTLARIEWKGETKEFELERRQIGTDERLERSEPCPSTSWSERNGR